jgi:predicted transcriptional regulator
LKELKKLPEAEFDVMKAIGELEPPITTNMLMERLGNDKGWRLQTLIALLLRLVDRGFLRSEKNSKERTYFPTIGKDEYLEFETSNFVERFHDRSVVNLINTLYDSKGIQEADLNELSDWLKKRGRK